MHEDDVIRVFNNSIKNLTFDIAVQTQCDKRGKKIKHLRMNIHVHMSHND